MIEMAQKPQVVDITKSYLPCDPEHFLENMMNTQKEDGEEETLPIVAFEGYNFLPTSYGYRSYFGQNSNLGIGALTSRVQHIINFQTSTYVNYLIAMCEDGIWIKDLTVAGAWTHSVTNTFDPDIFEEWTYCTIENILYMYRQAGDSVYHTIDTAGVLTIDSFTPTFLNMAGQIGIFKAGTRLGFWDSANSVSWSSNLELHNFTPDLENLAGNAIFAEIVGKIVTIRSSGQTFIIYSSGSIVGTAFMESSNLVWDSKKILEVGIINPRNICFGSSDSEHFAWTTGGVYKIGKYAPMTGKYELELIVPELYDLLKESRNPVYLDCLHERYLCFQVFDTKYLLGTTSSNTHGIDPTLTHLKIGEDYWDGDYTVLPDVLDGNVIKTIIDQWLAGNDPDSDCIAYTG